MGYWQFIFWTAGFTGTRLGLARPQQAALARMIGELRPARIHHGDCTGADREMHLLARGLGIPVAVHPPDSGRLRAFCETGAMDEAREPRPYLERNRDIVDESSYLIACPLGAETRRSGTWATVRYARRRHRNVVAIFPDGTVEVDGTADGG